VLRLVEHGQRHLGQIHDLHGETAVISRVLSDPSPHGETRTARSGAVDDHIQQGAVSPPGFIRDPPVDGFVVTWFGLYSPTCAVHPLRRDPELGADGITPRNAGHQAPGATDAIGQVAVSTGKACGGTLKH
jgi:hypothetical protein